MTPLFFDLIVAALIIISLALGFVRGFCREIFTIIGWVAAILATIYFTPELRGLGRSLIEKEWLADLVTSTAIFGATMGGFALLSYFATKTIHLTSFGIVDRVLGFAFGLLRAVIMSGLGFLLFVYVYPNADDRPNFINDARSMPFLEASGKWVQVFLPKDNKILVRDADSEVAEQQDKQLSDQIGDAPDAETQTP